MAFGTAKELNTGQMAQFTKVIGGKIARKDEADSFTMIQTTTKASGKTIKRMGGDFTYTMVGQAMRANGRMTARMVTVKNSGKTGHGTRAATRTVKSMGQGPSAGQMPPCS